MRASLWPGRAFADARGWRKIREIARALLLSTGFSEMTEKTQQVSRGVDRWLIGRVFTGVPDGAAKRSVDRQDLRTGFDFFPGESLV
jgi:hypothetical protein